MPGGLMIADTNFPRFTGTESAEQKITTIQNYLLQLTEQLRWAYANIGKENFNETEFKEISEEIAGPMVKKYESLDLTVKSAEDGASATIQITGEGLKTEAKIIQFNGIVTFKALEEEGKEAEDYTIINGAYIKTGTIDTMKLKGNEIEGGSIKGTTVEGSRIICSYKPDADGNNVSYGDILMKYNDRVRGGLQISDAGEGTALSARNRIWLYAQNGFVLKLDSDSRISIEADDQVYIATKDGASISLNGNRVDIATKDGASISLNGNRVDIKGNVYVNETMIGG